MNFCAMSARVPVCFECTLDDGEFGLGGNGVLDGLGVPGGLAPTWRRFWRTGGMREPST